jgi:hypothetical protein
MEFMKEALNEHQKMLRGGQILLAQITEAFLSTGSLR